MIKEYPFWWNDFLEQGSVLFDYMIHNYKSMINNENILHFDIISGDFCIDVSLLDKKNIISLLIPWIRAEYENGNLFNVNNWTPFSDPESILDMFLGYRRFFIYRYNEQEHYLQLGIELCCRTNSCVNCIERDSLPGEGIPHFILAYYGWKRGNSTLLEPYNTYSINNNADYILEKYWDI